MKGSRSRYWNKYHVAQFGCERAIAKYQEELQSNAELTTAEFAAIFLEAFGRDGWITELPFGGGLELLCTVARGTKQ